MVVLIAALASPAAAQVTVSTAAELQAAVAAGAADISIRAGVYNLTASLELSVAGTATLQNFGDGQVTLTRTGGRVLRTGFVTGRGSYIIRGLTFARSGSAIDHAAGDIRIEDSTFVENDSAVYTDSSAAIVTIVNSTFWNNRDGAIHLDAHRSAHILNSTIVGTVSGAGVYGLDTVNGSGPEILENSVVLFNMLDCQFSGPGATITNSIDSDGTCGSATTHSVTSSFELTPAIGTGLVRIATTPDRATFVNYQAIDPATLPQTGLPPGLTFPYGVFAWQAFLTPGPSLPIAITFPASIATASPIEYWKFDPVIGWFDLCHHVTCTLSPDERTLSFTITDGGVGDLDGVVNGIIHDPGGLGLSGDANTPPTLSLPAGITAEAAGAAGASVTFAVDASDAEEGPLAASCAPGSGALFPLGMTTVNCTATDADGATASGAFTVTVVDTTPPAIATPGNITQTAPAGTGDVVNFIVSAADLVSGSLTPACAPASGSVFSIGSTTVTCTAQDAAGNGATASFTVTVLGPAGEHHAPTLTRIYPDSGKRGTWQLVFFQGTELRKKLAVQFSGEGITVMEVVPFNTTTAVALVHIKPNADRGPRAVTVSNAFGTSNPVTYVVR
jgi:hypothetical protein